MTQSRQIFTSRLLRWYKNNKRVFPWRKTKNPYAILIAELLLRKTTANQVKAIYENFLKSFPDVKSLARASEKELYDMLRPLGMEYKRANLLIKFAEYVLNTYNGNIPKNLEDLLDIPGVGYYSANALLCFAFNSDTAIVDTNVLRVIERVFNIKSNKGRPRDDLGIWEFANTLTRPGKARALNLAILDFAALICKSRAPKCGDCILNDICYYKIKEVSDPAQRERPLPS
jgi:A/G-specific adenine glycosylase